MLGPSGMMVLIVGGAVGRSGVQSSSVIRMPMMLIRMIRTTTATSHRLSNPTHGIVHGTVTYDNPGIGGEQYEY
jgi:hypothetical protein